MYVFLLDEAGVHVYDQKILTDVLSIESEQYEVGLFEFAHEWQKE